MGVFISLVGCESEKNAKESEPQQSNSSATRQDPKALLEAAIIAKDWQRADKHANAALIAYPGDPDLLTKVAQVNALCDRKRDAAKLLVEAATIANYQPRSRLDLAIRALIDVGEIYLAIELLDQFIQANPDQDQYRRMLVGFLAEVQRTELLGPHLKALIQHRAFDLTLLSAVTDTSSRRLSEQTSSRLMQRNPNDHRVRLADAYLYLHRRDSARAGDVLEDIVQRHPNFAPAHAMYGQALALGQRWNELPAWFESTPPESDQLADYWLTLGDAEIKSGNEAAAVHAYWEATKRDANSIAAWDRLRTAIYRLREGDSEFRNAVSEEQLQLVSDHANTLLAIIEKFNDFAGQGKVSQRLAAEVASLLMKAGRNWEAEAWSAVATTLDEDPAESLADVRSEIVHQLRLNSNWISETTPARKLNFSFLPKPRFDSHWQGVSKSSIVPQITTHDHLLLSEQSSDWGLAGVGANNNPADGSQVTLSQTTGSGGGAIDFDLDGRPDLLIVNAAGRILATDSTSNELLRNLGTTFLPVSVFAGTGDRGYGQGVAVGDYNEDGFPDLFYANLGKNCLLRNNGDGTFTDCTDVLNDSTGARWSTSACFVDLNRDSISDLVITNYCRADAGVDQTCLTDEGTPTPCHPLKFAAEFDQFFSATKTGQFNNVTDEYVEVSTPGRGLGVVAGTFKGNELGIFVANDMSRNSFYSREAAGSMELVDSAAARGVAVDALARTQASMGIATGDFDLDGDLDLYVTGFGREYNIYYEQIATGIWKDETGKLGLIEPTLPMIGFGTQAIDFDCDGLDELIITNGHIGDFSGPDVPPYALPIQLFRRSSQGKFDLVQDDQWGDYFSSGHVGRALWITDVNRDGRNDFFVSHTHEQVRLIINRSHTQNNRIAFKLVATSCSRDAVGAVIRFECDGQRRTLWRLSGDGYLCSNEKTLLAGLGSAKQISQLTVTWQDGSVDQIGTLDANRQYLITQGQSEAFPLHDYPQ